MIIEEEEDERRTMGIQLNHIRTWIGREHKKRERNSKYFAEEEERTREIANISLRSAQRSNREEQR
jgi:hypothetical protein